MIYIISTISSFVLSIKKHPKQILLSLLLIAYMAFLMGVVTPSHSFDTYAYQMIYGWTPQSHRFEPGYMWFSYLFFKMGVPYTIFRIIFYALSLVGLWWAIKRFNGNLLTYFSIFLIYPFLIEITQVRNFGMIALVAIAMSFYKDQTLKSNIIGTFFLILSVLFQSSGLFYIIVPFLLLLDAKKLQKIVEVGYLVMTILYLIFHYIIPVGLFKSIVLFVFKITGRHVTNASNNFGSGSSFSMAFGYILFLGILILVWKLLLQEEPHLLNDNRYKISYAVLVLSVIAVFLMSSTIDFERYIRDGFTLSLIGLTIYERQHVKRKVDKRFFWVMIAILLVVASFAWHYWDPSPSGRLQFLIYLIQLFPNINWA